MTFLKGQAIVLDTASALYSSLNGAGALRPFTDGDTRGRAGLAN
jgi:hypothetical protein